MKYEYWFAGIRNIPDRTKIKLKEKAGTAEAIYYIEETALRKMQLLKEQEIWKLLEAKKKEELDRNYEAMRQKGISVDRKSTRLNSSHLTKSRMPSSA